EALVAADGHLDGAAARPHADHLALAKAIAIGVFRRDVEALAAAERRAIAGGLHAGVVLLEPAPCGQAQRKLGVEAIDRRIVLHRDERHARTANRPLPQPAVQEHLPRLLLAVAR